MKYFRVMIFLLAVWAAGCFGAEKVPVSGKLAAADAISRKIDLIEIIFWRGLLSAPNGAARASLTKNIEELQMMCRKLQNERDVYVTRRHGNPTAASMRLKNIVEQVRLAPAKGSISGLKRTSVAEYVKSTRKNRRRGEEEKLSDAGYKAFLDETAAKNLEIISRKFSGNAELTRTRINLINKLAEDYYAALVTLRMTMFNISQNECNP
jgi:hypothetical protein